MAENIDKLKEKVAKDPSSKLFVPLADEYKKQGQAEKAIEVLKAGLERQPSYMSARVALGKIYLEKNMLAEAKGEFEKVINAIPDNLFAQRKLADIYKDLGDTANAAIAYEAVLRLNPMDEEARTMLSTIERDLPEEAAPEIMASPEAQGGWGLPEEVPPEIPPELAGQEQIASFPEDIISFPGEEGIPASFELPQGELPSAEAGEAVPKDIFELETEAPSETAFEMPGEEESEAVAGEPHMGEEAAGVLEIPEELAVEEPSFGHLEDLAHGVPLEEPQIAFEIDETQAEGLDFTLPSTPLEPSIEGIEPSVETATGGFETTTKGGFETATGGFETATKGGFETTTGGFETTTGGFEWPSEKAGEEAVPISEEAEPFAGIPHPFDEASEPMAEAAELFAETAEPLETLPEFTIGEEAPEAAEPLFVAPEPLSEMAPQFGEDLMAEAAPSEFSGIDADIAIADAFIAQGDYGEALKTYSRLLAGDPKNKIVLQRVYELKSLLKFMGKDAELVASKLEAFLEGIRKRRDEFFRNA